jgi:glycosyltransferase involved in cell wall biosynthesis
LTPLLALALARLRGARTVVVLHEWSDLNPMRRAIVSFYLIFAKAILISSPSVRTDFEASAAGRMGIANWLVPIPPNIAPPRERLSTDAVVRIRKEKAAGRVIIGQFGSIYPKKQSDFVLDVASAAKIRGLNAFVVFIGGFIKGSDDVEARFRSRVRELGLEDRVLVTGYVETDAEIFSLFDAVDVFAYSFSEGLTSRRGSVLACLQSGRPVVVNAPANKNEFDHHPVFKRLIDEGALQLVPTDASQSEFAAAVARIAGHRASSAPEIFIEAWRDAAAALRAALR